MAPSMDSWVREYNEAVELAVDVTNMISERSSLPQSGREARQHSAALPRKIAILDNKLGSLQCLLAKLPSKQSLTKKEMNRRRNMAASLRSKFTQMASTLNMSNLANKDNLVEPKIESVDAMSRATGLDNQEILALQRQIMKEQDDSIVQLEETVTSITHIALAVNEELDLHKRLLDDLDQHVEDTDSKLRKLLKRMAAKMKNLFSCMW